MLTKDSCNVSALETQTIGVKMATFKRPLLKLRVREPLLFTTRWQGGAQVSEWLPDTHKRVIPSGTPGRVGEIVDLINKGPPAAFRKTPWSPPYDYDFYARQKIAEKDREEYISRCANWFRDHPPKVFKSKPKPEPYDVEMVAKFWQGKTAMPPLEDRVKIYRAAGISEERIQKHIDWDAKMAETADARQKAVDDVFGKYAGSKAKTVKPKAKVIKPVKKKMT